MGSIIIQILILFDLDCICIRLIRNLMKYSKYHFPDIFQIILELIAYTASRIEEMLVGLL